jgi:hypothetical protein
MAIVRLEGLGRLKKFTSSGFGLATFRLVVRYGVPPKSKGAVKNTIFLDVTPYSLVQDKGKTKPE